MSDRQHEIARQNFDCWMAVCNNFITAAPLTLAQEDELWNAHYLNHIKDSVRREDVPGFPFK